MQRTRGAHRREPRAGTRASFALADAPSGGPDRLQKAHGLFGHPLALPGLDVAPAAADFVLAVGEGLAGGDVLQRVVVVTCCYGVGEGRPPANVQSVLQEYLTRQHGQRELWAQR